MHYGTLKLKSRSPPPKMLTELSVMVFYKELRCLGPQLKRMGESPLGTQCSVLAKSMALGTSWSGFDSCPLIY